MAIVITCLRCVCILWCHVAWHVQAFALQAVLGSSNVSAKSAFLLGQLSGRMSRVPAEQPHCTEAGLLDYTSTIKSN